jgi:hypothetical protein
MRDKLRSAIHFRIEQQNGLVTYRDAPDLHISRYTTERRLRRISLNPMAQTQNIISFSVTEGLSLPEEL